jgi:hypothetical protein
MNVLNLNEWTHIICNYGSLAGSFTAFKNGNRLDAYSSNVGPNYSVDYE